MLFKFGSPTVTADGSWEISDIYGASLIAAEKLIEAEREHLAGARETHPLRVLSPCHERTYGQYLEVMRTAGNKDMTRDKVYALAKAKAKQAGDADFPDRDTWKKYLRTALRHHKSG